MIPKFLGGRDLLFLTSGPSDSSGRNTVWIFTSSVFMTVGDADTPWHPQFFSAATFESQCLTQDSTTIDLSHGPRLEEELVAHFVILPIYHEGGLCCVKLLNLGCFSLAEKHVRIVLVMELLMEATDHFFEDMMHSWA